MAGVRATVVGATATARPEKRLDVESYDSVHVWLEGSRASESWARHGKQYLAEFCSLVGRTPDQLLEERRRGLRNNPDWSKEEIELDRWIGIMTKTYSFNLPLTA